MKNNRIKRLESARMEAMSGNYKKAMNYIDKLLSDNTVDIDAMILKGNIMELEVFDNNMDCCLKEAAIEDMMKARQIYQKVLCHEPTNIMAMRDLAQNYNNTGEFKRSNVTYRKLIKLLKKMTMKEMINKEELTDIITEYERIKSERRQLRKRHQFGKVL